MPPPARPQNGRARILAKGGPAITLLHDHNPGVKHSEEDNDLGEQTMRELMATLPKGDADLLTDEVLTYE
jgi:hypothetical protein